MTIPEQHVETAPALVVMPDTSSIHVSSVSVPRPVTLNDLIGRADRDLRRLYGTPGCAASWRPNISSDTPDPEGVAHPVHQIAVAVLEEAIALNQGVTENISFICRTREDLDRLSVTIQRSVCGCDKDIICSVFTPHRRPIHVDRIKFGIVIRIHHVGQPNLSLVTGALNLVRFGFRAAQSRKQHASQDGDNGNDN
jgi:hypothetical protein